jgi:hypothetical protein
VLVALTILGLAIVTLMQLSSQGLRLLRVSEDYQQAVVAVASCAAPTCSGGVDAGREALPVGRRIAHAGARS